MVVNILGVHVNIDETRGDDLVFGVDQEFRLGGRETPDPGDTAILDRDRAAKPRVAGTVNDPGVDDDKVEGLLLGRQRSYGHCDEREQKQQAWNDFHIS